MPEDPLYERVAALWAPHILVRPRISYHIASQGCQHTMYFCNQMPAPLWDPHEEPVLRLRAFVYQLFEPTPVVAQLTWYWNDMVRLLQQLQAVEASAMAFALTGDLLELNMSLQTPWNEKLQLSSRPWQTCSGTQLALDTDTGVIYHQDTPVADLLPTNPLEPQLVCAWLSAPVYLRALDQKLTAAVIALRHVAQKARA